MRIYRVQRFRPQRGEDGKYSGPTIVSPSDDDGYVSPALGLPSESEDDRIHFTFPQKKKPRRADKSTVTLEEEEELVLKLLRR